MQTEYDINLFQLMSQNIIKAATLAGASETEVKIHTNQGFNVGVHDNDVETIEYNKDKVVEITVYFGKRMGSASSSDFRPEAIKSAIAAACYIAKLSDEDNAAGLADTELLAFRYPQLQLAFPWDISVEKAIQLACDCEREALAYDERILRAEEVSIATVEALSFYANSAGFCGHYNHTRHEISCIMIAKQGESMERDYCYSVSPDPATLTPISKIAQDASRRAVNRLGALTLPTMKTPVIFMAEEARSLFGHFIAAIQGGNIYRKSSFLLDQIGQPIFPKHLQIKENPHLQGAMGSAPFDEDGVLTKENVFVQDGVLQQYALSSYSARKLGRQSTGNSGGVHNLTVTTTDRDIFGMIKLMDKGLLVTELMGQGVNLVSGQYSRGVAGFWIENGEVKYPVNEITVAGNLKDMYAHIIEIGGDIDTRGNVRTGSLLIEEMTVAGA